MGKSPAAVSAADVESFLLNLCRKGRAPRTRNVALAGVSCLLCVTTGSTSDALQRLLDSTSRIAVSKEERV